jgi:tetratricopeptide (TPR) repeat protein
MNPLEIHKHVAQSSGREVGEISPLAAELTELAVLAEGQRAVTPGAVTDFEGGELADTQRHEAKLRPAQEMRQTADEIFAEVRDGIMTNPHIKSDRHRMALLSELLLVEQATSLQADILLNFVEKQGVAVGEQEVRDATYSNLARVYARNGAFDEAIRLVDEARSTTAIQSIFTEVGKQVVIAGRTDELRELFGSLSPWDKGADGSGSTLFYAAAVELIDRGELEKANEFYPTGSGHLDNLLIAHLGLRQIEAGETASAQATLAQLSARADSVNDARELQTAITRALLDAGETNEVERLVGESEDREYRIVADVLVAARRGTHKELDMVVFQTCQLVDLSDEEITALVGVLLDELEWDLADDVIAKQLDWRLADNLRLKYIEKACSDERAGLALDTLEERVRATSLTTCREAAYRHIVSALARSGKWQEAREVIDSTKVDHLGNPVGSTAESQVRLRLEMLLAAGMRECADKMEAAL